MKRMMHKLGIHLPANLKLHCNPMEMIYHPVEWSDVSVEVPEGTEDKDIEEMNRVQFNKNFEQATGMVVIEHNHDHHHHFQAFYNLMHHLDPLHHHNHNDHKSEKHNSKHDSKIERHHSKKDDSYEYSHDNKYDFRFWHHEKRQQHHDHHHDGHHHKHYGLKKHCKLNYIAPEICIQDINTRVAILRKLYHPNLMPLKSIYDDDKYLYFIYVLHDDIQLLTTAIHNLEEAYTESVVKSWIHQILLGLNYLHEHGITHGDLSLNSLFYRTSNKQVCIGRYEGNRLRPKIPPTDQGLNLEGRLRRIHQLATTAPEVSHGKRYGQAADIWSLGVVSHLLLTGEYPSHHPTGSNHNSSHELSHNGSINHHHSHINSHLHRNSDSQSNLSVDDNHSFKASKSHSIRSFDNSEHHSNKHNSSIATNELSPLAKNLLIQLMAPQDIARPTAKQALSHPWFSTDSTHNQRIGSNTGEKKGFNLGLVMRLGNHVSPESSKNNTEVSLHRQSSHK